MTGHQRSTASGARILVRRVHLWLGLSLGLLFAVLGLTGSALVFYTGIDAALHPAIQAGQDNAAPGLTAPVWDRALATGRSRWHDPGGKWTLEVTPEGGLIPARYYPAPGRHGDRQMIWFSADGRRIVRAEPWGRYLMSWLYQLHMQLLAGEIGSQVVGWSGVAMLVLLVSGVLAWWPRGSWRKALAFKRDTVPIRRLRDLHKLSGLWSMLLLFVLVATGVLLALPTVTRVLLAPAAIPAPKSSDDAARQITVVQALGAAHRALPDGRIMFIDVPNARDGAIRVRLQVPGDPHRRFPGSYVFIDQFSGRLLAVHDVRRAGTGTTMAAWVRTLHDGTIGGLATRVLAVLLGFVPTLLLATGILHWLRRRKAASSGRPS
ncbi:PepSY-associated TM helix domain-containing protein [Sphingomonas sp. CFBP 8760]|uniref:PepSY-associated TM helix domain-containing protein n=1 Tax=Sphingomonas sp. CFBP 8760 TaxID=2775282 RepID=UPI00177B85D4|nr:PepSY-associated TM helix domain-containing protein [Sphingomonas sp. CFBP 8760]MBD8546815.1 PepSY domain-containing protein [Sphingomonas sp. CFBP 8760]